MSDDFEINGREYNLDYKEQSNRTIIVISSLTWDEQDVEFSNRLQSSLARSLVISTNERLPRMLFVQKREPNGVTASVPILELKQIIKTCLNAM
jgi:hypothetical protein